jgi:hypothetical protein
VSEKAHCKVTLRKDESYFGGHEIEIGGLREGDIIRIETDKVLVNGIEFWKAPPNAEIKLGLGFSVVPGGFMLAAKDASDDGLEVR